MSAEKQPASCWLKGPWTDLIIGCGGWSLPLITLAAWGNATNMVAMSLTFYVLAMFVNNPHFFATIYRAYGTRGDFRKYRFFTLYVTLFMVLTVIVLHWKPQLVPWVFTTYLLWSPWHYSGQNFGISMMMARRAGITPTPQERNYLQLAYISSYLLWVVSLMAQPSEDPKVLTLGLPLSAAQPLVLGFAALFIVSSLFAIGAMAQRTSLKQIIAPAVMTLSQSLWFVIPNLLAYVLQYELPATYWSAGILAFLHCTQYLWVTGYYTRREVELGQRGTHRQWHPLRYYATLIIGGIALFIPGPWIASSLFGHDLLESLFIFLALVGLHHFILDGAIWKLREGSIARLLLGDTSAQQHPTRRPNTNPQQPATPEAELHAPLIQAPKPIIYGIAAVILATGLIDQLQYALTIQQKDLNKIALAQKLNRNDSRVHYRRARILYEQGDRKGALEAVEQAIAINRYQLPPHNLRAQILAEAGNIEEAYQEFAQMTQLFSPIAPILVNAGVFAAHTNRLTEAINRYEHALQMQPDRYEIYLYLGEAHQLLNHWEDALLNYNKYLTFSPPPHAGEATPQELLQYQKLFGAIAQCYEILGEPNEAQNWRRQQQRITPQ